LYICGENRGPGNWRQLLATRCGRCAHNICIHGTCDGQACYGTLEKGDPFAKQSWAMIPLAKFCGFIEATERHEIEAREMRYGNSLGFIDSTERFAIEVGDAGTNPEAAV
jgi:hypothetical protein